MPRGTDSVGSVVALFCLLNTFLLAPLLAQSVDTRQPDIADWRLFHRNNDAYWARSLTDTTGWNPDHSKITFSASDVRRIRLRAGIADDEPADPIVWLGGMGKQPDRYLLLTARTGGCLRAAVYGRGFRQFRELWSSDALSNAGGICQQSDCPRPNVFVYEQHKISISTYFHSTPTSPMCDQVSTTIFEPKGNTFEEQDQHTSQSMCWVGYWPGLSAALWNAAGPTETIAMVQVLPSFSHRYALALRRDASGTRVLRLEWPETGSPLMGELTKQNASDCFARTASTDIKATVLEVPQDKAEELATALSRIDLRADRCVRNAGGECTVFLDGTNFQVEIPGHAAIEIFDLRQVKGYVSQNPELSEWIYKLLDEAKHSKKTAPN